jgi:hypothetical protein
VQQWARSSSSLSFAAGLDPVKLSKAHPVTLSNFVDGSFKATSQFHDVVDPLNGEPFIRMPRTSVAELDPFVASLKRVPKVRNLVVFNVDFFFVFCFFFFFSKKKKISPVWSAQFVQESREISAVGRR